MPAMEVLKFSLKTTSPDCEKKNLMYLYELFYPSVRIGGVFWVPNIQYSFDIKVSSGKLVYARLECIKNVSSKNKKNPVLNRVAV